MRVALIIGGIRRNSRTSEHLAPTPNAFGLRLMAEPKLVGDRLAAMEAAVSVPVTVKCRIGIGCSDVRIFARFLQQACPRVLELRSPIFIPP